jgi:DNA mismatch repair protein MutL
VYLSTVPRIRLLPDSLINQIAAGEVVERPASVVKELVENSLDAGASRVLVRLQAGGRELVEVDDDGCGMDHDDALLALERHATSKLGSASDLERIATLGFRGEALPSIAAVSSFVLETAAADGEGTRVEVDHGRIRGAQPCARARGTRVTVRDLFARLPARRKFLRTEGTELRHAIGIVTGLAFAHPEVAFVLEHKARRLLDLPPARAAEQRLHDLLGPDRAAQAVAFTLARSRASVEGLLLPPTPSHELILVVNGRLVRDRLLAGVVNRALRGPAGTLEADLFLHLTVDPEDVDVNVHPTKAEVRFADAGAVSSLLTQALATARVAAHRPGEIRRFMPVGPHQDDPGRRPPSGAFEPYRLPLFAANVAEALPSRTYEPEPAPPGASPWGRFLGQYRATYLVLEDDEGLVLVDQHAAHERVLYERLLALQERAPTQRMLVPEVVELPARLAALAEETAPALEELGLEIEPASATTLRVLAVPTTLSVSAAGALVQQLLADLDTGAAPGGTLRERAAASLACHAAIKKNWTLSRLEAERLLADLAGLYDPHRCPHGRPTMLRLAHAEIERRIGRR